MNYLEWNNAIINHFFNSDNEEKEVVLYFSEEVINEIGEKNFPLPENGYIEDFFHALRIGVPGTQNNNYIQRILDLDSRFRKELEIDGITFNYPPYFSYLIAFLLPFTSGATIEGVNINNFHKYVKTYFENKNLTSDYDKNIKNKLKDIDHLWDKIVYWLFEKNNFSLGIIETIDDPVQNRKYVSKFEYHILFRKEQEDKLSIIFDNNNILPNEPYDESKMRKLLIENSTELQLSKDTIDKIKKKKYIGEKLVKRALKYYQNWDGTNKYDYIKKSGETIRKRGYSRKRLVACLDFNILTQKIVLKHFRIYSADGLPEEFTLIDSTEKEFHDIVQDLRNPLYSLAINDCFQNLEQSVELIDNTNKIKYSWKAKDFYLFKRDSQLNDWIEIPQIDFNIGKTLIITKKDFYNTKLKKWFESDNIPIEHKKLYKDNIKNSLPEEWLAITIEQITHYQHPSLQELKTSSEITPRINFNKEFFFDACFFSDNLPKVWIDNYEVDEKPIYAEYSDGTKINFKKIDKLNIFIFTEEHTKRKYQKFKIKYNNIEYHRFIKIVDFDKKLTNNEIKNIQPRRNLVGNTLKSYEISNNYFQGIEHCFANEKLQKLKVKQKILTTNGCNFVSSRDASIHNNNYSYNKAHKGNILLNYTSLKGRITKIEYDNAVSRLLRNSDDQKNLKKHIRFALYDLQNMGYVDYDVEQGVIYINKSSLVIKPTESGITLLLVGARDNEFIQEIINYSKKGHCYIDIQKNENELLPQTIFVKFKKPNIKIVSDFAKHFDLQFKIEEQLFTQFALANAHNLSDWDKFVMRTNDLNFANDFEGGEIFDIHTLYFKDKSENFDKQLAFVRFQNINGYKTVYRLWYRNEAYHIAEQHYGVYLFLYLYRELKSEQHKVEKEKRIINYFEFKEKEQSVKSLTNVLFYDDSNNWLGVPLNCALPKYFSIAFMLLSGEKPEIRHYNNRAYLIYKNVPFLFCNNSLVMTLKQQFDENNRKQILF